MRVYDEFTRELALDLLLDEDEVAAAVRLLSGLGVRPQETKALLEAAARASYNIRRFALAISVASQAAGEFRVPPLPAVPMPWQERLGWRLYETRLRPLGLALLRRKQ